MQFNEERVKLFATIIRLLTNPEIMKTLADKGEEFDFENLVRAIAEMVPYPQMAPIDVAAPIINPCPLPHVFPTVPSLPWVPMQPLRTSDPLPMAPTVICSGNTSVGAMTQGDGMGDDAGFRGD